MKLNHTRKSEIAALGYLSAKLASKAKAWEGEAPDWFPEPPEWLELWEEAKRITSKEGL